VEAGESGKWRRRFELFHPFVWYGGPCDEARALDSTGCESGQATSQARTTRSPLRLRRSTKET